MHLMLLMHVGHYTLFAKVYLRDSCSNYLHVGPGLSTHVCQRRMHVTLCFHCYHHALAAKRRVSGHPPNELHVWSEY